MNRIQYIKRMEELLNKNEALPAPYYRITIEQASELFNTLNAFGLFEFLKLAGEYGLPKEIFEKEAQYTVNQVYTIPKG